MAEAAAQRFDEVLVRLSKYMAETGDAVMPTAELADYQKDAAAMAKAGVLVEREAGYAFFHERYRDLNIARQLTVGASPVVEWLLAVGQPLYRRGEVRRLLAYQRLEDRDVYLENLREVLGSTEIRLHIKAVLFDLLASLTDPWPEEWKVVDPFLEDGKAREHHLARQLLTTEAWATLADEIGVLDRWSTGSEHQREVFIVTLRSAPGTTWNKWAPFIREQALTNDEWRRRVLWVLTWAPVAESRALFEVVIDLLGNGLFDNSEGTKLDTRHLLVVLHELPEKQPEWAVEFIAVYVKRGQQLAREQGEPNPFRLGKATIPDTRREDVFIERPAKEMPRRVLDELLPIVLDLARENAYPDSPEPIHDSVWASRDISGEDLPDAMLEGLELALQTLAAQDADALAPFLTTLLEASQYEVAQYLLHRTWQAAGEALADDAIEYLARSHAHLKTRYGSSDFWTARQLIHAASPGASPDRLQALERSVLSLDEGEDMWTARAQFELLGGFAPGTLTEAGARRLRDFQTQFERDEAEPPTRRFRSIAGFVGPPIPEDEARAFTNEQWLDAMRRYPTDDRDREEFLVGGATQLARVLQKLTAEDPDRFAEFGLSIPDDTNPVYLEGILIGLGEGTAAVKPDLLWPFLDRCHEFPGRPFGRWFDRPVGRLPDGVVVPELIVDHIAWYATEDPDPENDEWFEKQIRDDGQADPHGQGINSVRGSAAEGLASVLLRDKSQAQRLRPTIERVCADRTIQVRACAATTLLGLLDIDADYAIRLLNQMLEVDNEYLNASRSVERFLSYATWRNYAATQPALERLSNSAYGPAQAAGARQSTLVALRSEQAIEFVERAMGGSDDARRGVAQVAAANLGDAAYAEFLEGLLQRLFRDDAPTVREAAGDCFRQLEPDQVGKHRELIRDFIRTPAFAGNPGDLFDALEKSAEPIPQEAIEACRAFIAFAGRAAGDFATRAAFDASNATNLILAAYLQAEDQAQADEALDVIDELVANRAYGVERALQTIDDY